MFTVGRFVNGRFLLAGVGFSLTKNKSDMVSCTVIAETGESISAVCFADDVVKALRSTAESLGVSTGFAVEADVELTVQEYNGRVSAKIDRVTSFYEPDMSKYMEKLDVKAIMDEIKPLLGESLSDKGRQIAGEILKENWPQLKLAMAAMYGGYHDGVQGGLLNHIRKLLHYGKIAMKEYENVFTAEERDLVILGLLVHDFGKIVEIENGGYSAKAIVPHTYWGIEVLMKHKARIEELYNEMFFVELQAIILEHHGEFGERPKTVYAYLVHVIDLLDSRVSGLWELLKEGSPQSVKFDDYRLTFNRYGKE